MDEILGIIMALVFLYYIFDVLHFIVVHWVWFAVILGGTTILSAIFFPGSSSSKSSGSAAEGDYTVYDLGKPTVSVDRFHIRKD